MAAKIDPATLPYRSGAGVVLFKDDGMVFAGRRIDNPSAWQMPQGGIDFGELPEEGALRELTEETGVMPKHVRIEAQSTEWFRYDLPSELLGKIWRGKYRGQEQMWFAMRFLGSDEDVNIATDHAEFSEWCWMAPDDLINKIVPFKRELYRLIFDEFAGHLR
jgi:putative (di)nucleoside polyphosphate hydrolase